MSKYYHVAYAPEAVDDLRAIFAYIAFPLKARDTARGQVARIRREIARLNEMPERYVAVDWEPWSSRGMRKLTVDNYVVYYLVEPTAQLVTVVRIFYGGRDVENIIK